MCLIYILYFFVILAVIYADSCGNSTSRRLQAKAVPAESVHKKTANKVGDFVDSLKHPPMRMLFCDSYHSNLIFYIPSMNHLIARCIALSQYA